MRNRLSRRDVLKGSGALALGLSSTTKVLSAAPPASAVTPELIAAARKEGKVVYYTSIDLPLAEKIAKAFEAKYPGIAVRVERTGAERVFQRIGQEYASRIYAVDAVNSSDAAHFIVWKRDGLLAPYVPEDVAQHYPADHKDADGLFASFRVGLERHRLQHRSGEAGGRAEELRRSARSEMEGQDRQGASELQRHHHDRDLPVGARPRLGRISRSSRSRASCRCSRRPTRRRSSRSASAPCRPTATSTTCSSFKEAGQPVEPLYASRRHAAGDRPERHVQERAESERRAAVPELLLQRRSASSSSSTSAACVRCIRRPRRSRAASRSRTSRP